ncbi:MAG TPA: diacylglycerol kinase family protein [Bacteroidetes bacterium]|nr:diacylglycerol kinase family protein [Bacteroidota bacterium]
MVKRLLNSFGFALAGIRRLFATQPNARVHLVVTVLVLAGGFYFKISTAEWCLSVVAIAAVLAAEAFNTALEDLTDLVSPDHHPLAGHAKDMAAGAVLLTAAGAAIVGLLIFLPKILNLLS